MQKKRAIIFCNGNTPPKTIIDIYKLSDTIICADGGTKHALKLGITPTIVIGDLDSLPKTTVKDLEKKRIIFLQFPPEKDQTDGELAIHFAIEKGFSEIIVTGSFGDRIDHFLGVLLFAAKQNSNITFLEGKQSLTVVSGTQEIRGEKGDTVSLIPLFGDAKGVMTKGLLYSLKNESLFIGKTRGVSNEMISKKATIKVVSGVVLVIHTFSKP